MGYRSGPRFSDQLLRWILVWFGGSARGLYRGVIGRCLMARTRRRFDGKTTVYDFNATLLHLIGLDHERLPFYHNVLERRLTNVHGHAIADILA